jgi:hypothetical protein
MCTLWAIKGCTWDCTERIATAVPDRQKGRRSRTGGDWVITQQGRSRDALAVSPLTAGARA